MHQVSPLLVCESLVVNHEAIYLSSITTLKDDGRRFQLWKYAGELWQKYGNFSVGQQSGTLLSYSREESSNCN